MKDKAFALLMQAFSSKAGSLVQWAVGAAIGYAVAWLTQVGFAPSPALVNEFTVYAVGVGMALVSGWFNAYQATQATKLQTALEVLPDGWIGPVTIRRAAIANQSAGVAP